MQTAVQLSVIIPIFNEALNINALFSRLTTAVAPLNLSTEFIFINDGSRDNSLLLIRQLATDNQNVKYIDFSRNFGHQIAVTAGLDLCQGQAVVIIDADLQDPPELIVDLYNKMQQGYEVVYARRRQRQGESFTKLLTARVFYRLLAAITSVEIPVDTGDFRIMHRKVVDTLKQMHEQQKFLRGQISWIGFRQTYVEYDRSAREGGKSGYTYAKMIRFAMDGITSFSDFPLKLATFMGFAVSGVAFLVLLYALYGKLFGTDTVAGWASIITSVLFLGGIQLMTIGIIGEYIGRISANVKNRPLYVINHTNITNSAKQEN